MMSVLSDAGTAVGVVTGVSGLVVGAVKAVRAWQQRRREKPPAPATVNTASAKPDPEFYRPSNRLDI